MAAVPITIVGIITNSKGESDQVTLVGLSHITGLEVGGGPVYPPEIWGPNDPRPTPPIHIPPPPTEVPPGNPDEDGMVKDPPAGGGWGYNATFGWGYFPMKSGAGPKK